MCEYCAVYEVWGKPLTANSTEPRDCEWTPDSDDVGLELAGPDEMVGPVVSCEQKASCTVFDKSTEDHLCDNHHHQDRRDLEEGLGEFLNEFGFEQSIDYLSINADALCDYVGDLLSDTVTRCGGAATRVKMVTQEMVLCERHAKESGYTSVS